MNTEGRYCIHRADWAYTIRPDNQRPSVVGTGGLTPQINPTTGLIYKYRRFALPEIDTIFRGVYTVSGGCMADNMNIRLNERRERRLQSLCEATGENARSKAIDRAADLYVELRGDTTARPTGRIQQLMERAEAQGSVTPAEIAEILDTDALPVEYESEWSVGTES